MIKKLLRLFRLVETENVSARFEPVYGLPKQAFEEWLSRNPSMRERYAAELARASKRNRQESPRLAVRVRRTECGGR